MCSYTQERVRGQGMGGLGQRCYQANREGSREGGGGACVLCRAITHHMASRALGVGLAGSGGGWMETREQLVRAVKHVGEEGTGDTWICMFEYLCTYVHLHLYTYVCI